MSDDLRILRAAAELAESGKPFVLVSVIDTQGHTPRNVGAKMIWKPDGEPTGTVGGGNFEQLVSESAGMHFERRSCGKETFVLGAEAEQCCGGSMEVFFEYHGARHRVVIFGAGHVSCALASALAPANFEIVVIDDRREWNSAERFPHCRRVSDFDEGVAIATERPDATLACVMTCSHDTDLDVLAKLLRSPPAYTGLIGSESKRACFFTRLAVRGVDESTVRRVHCPMGLGDMGKEPALVAVSIAGQILLEAKALATL